MVTWWSFFGPFNSYVLKNDMPSGQSVFKRQSAMIAGVISSSSRVKRQQHECIHLPMQPWEWCGCQSFFDARAQRDDGHFTSVPAYVLDLIGGSALSHVSNVAFCRGNTRTVHQTLLYQLARSATVRHLPSSDVALLSTCLRRSSGVGVGKFGGSDMGASSDWRVGCANFPRPWLTALLRPLGFQRRQPPAFALH